MSERDLEKKCMAQLKAELQPEPLLWKIHDRVTGGQPDLEVNWNGATSKVEFKLLKATESIHDKWEDGRQLGTLIQYEKTTGRSWVVAYCLGSRRLEICEETRIYRPSALLHGKVPQAMIWEFDERALGRSLWERGVIRCEGFRHDMVARLIKETHI